MKKMFAILNPQNKQRGLWGTVYGTFGKETAEKLWTITSILVQEISDLNSNQTQKLLDSPWGKHTVGVFCNDIEHGAFIKAFRKKMTKELLQSDYKYYVKR